MESFLKAWLFLSIMSVTLIVFGHSYGGREGLLAALVLMLAINSYIYFYEDRRVIRRFQGRLVEGQDSYNLNDIVHRLSVKARVFKPKILVLPSLSPQIGSIGHNKSSGTVILTQGLLDKFSFREVEILIAYQIVCIKNTNTLAFAVGSAILSFAFFILGAFDALIRFLIVEKKNPATYVSQPFSRIFAPVVGLMLRFSIMPGFYTDADKATTLLAGEHNELAKALDKLDSYSKTLPFYTAPSFAHIFAVSPLNSKTWYKYFITQPSISKRIKKIVGYYPL